MRCRCKILSVNGIPASDGSIVPYDVMNNYINSIECKEALEKHKMLGSLTHRSRSIQSNFCGETAASLSKTVGKDDSLIIVKEGAPTPTHYIEDLFIEDGWLWGDIKIFDETGMDDIAIQNIRRLKGMISQGVMPGVSAVIVGYWNSNSGSGSDVLAKMVNLKGIDVTLNPSWKAAGVTEVLDDERTYSEHGGSGVKVKTFSNVSELGITAPMSSKVDGQYTRLKAKVFSCCESVSELRESDRKFSAVSVNERTKMAKLEPRERFRRLILDYRQAIKTQGGIGKLDAETLRVMKSLFSYDVLCIMQTVTPMVLEGKNFMTILGAGTLGPQVKKACQSMAIPYKMALEEQRKNGYVSKLRYQKIQESFTTFISALQDFVFGSSPIEDDTEDE